MAYTLPKGPRGDSPSDRGRRKKATKKKPKSSVGAAIKEAGTRPAPKPPTPKPGSRSVGRAIERAGAKAGPPTPRPSASGDRPSDRPDANARRKREVESQQRRDRQKSAIIAALESTAGAARKPLKRVDTSTGLTKLIKDRAEKGPTLDEFIAGRDHSKDFPGAKESKADAALGSVAVRILNETTRVARGVGEGIKASGGDPTDVTKWPDVAKAAGRAVVTNEGDMPGDAVVPKDKRGKGWDAARLFGNIAGDPATYLTVGAGTATRAGARAAAKKATKSALKQGATKKVADRAGRAAAKKVARGRPANNRGVSVGLRATIPGTSKPIIDVRTSGRSTAAVSRAVKAPQAAERVRGRVSPAVRKAPGTQAVRPEGRTPKSHTEIRRAQRELRAAQDTARREGAEVKRAVRKKVREARASGAEVYDRIETTPQGASLGGDATAEIARLVRKHLGRAFDKKRAAGLADKPFRPRDIETRVQPAVKVVRDKAGKTVAKQTTYKAQVKADGKWETVTRAGTKQEAEALRRQIHATADEMVKRGEIPASPDARRYAPHTRQPQTESVAPVPLASRQTRTNAEKAREIRKPLADANADAAAGGKVIRSKADLQNELFTDDIATTTGLHVQRAGEKAAEARFWERVAKTGKPLGQVVRLKGGVLDLSRLPKGGMVYRQDARGLHALVKGNSGELDVEAVRKAVKESGTGGNRFVVLDPKEVERVRERVFPKGNPRTDEYAQLFDRATGKIKWWLTIPNPSYHVRNLVGDTNLAWTGDANARSLVDAGLVMRGRTASQKAAGRGEKAAAARRTIDLGSRAKGSKRTLTHDELLKEAQDVGSISLGQGSKELDDLIHAGGQQGRLDSGPAAVFTRVNMRREDIPRLASHIAARRRGLTPQEAADWVNRHHFDYGDLNKADRGLRRAVPFATWWTRNTALQAVKLFERPGKAVTMAKLLDAAAKQAGFEDYEEFAEGLNTWQQDTIPVPVRGPFDGRLKVASIGPPQTDLNFHDWIGLMSGEGADDVAQAMGQDFLSRLNPIVKLPIELQQNRSFFFRGDIDPGQEGKGSSLEPAPNMPAPMRKFFGVVRYRDKRDGKEKWGWDKTVAYSVRQSLPLANRAVGLLTPGMSDRNQTSSDALVSFAGVNISDFDQSVEKAATNRRYDRRDELRARKRYLEDTQKTKGKEYRKVVVELKVLEKELAPPRKRAKKRSGFGDLIRGGGGGGFREIMGSSVGGAGSGPRASVAREDHAEKPDLRAQQDRRADQRRQADVPVPKVQVGDRAQHVAQATPRGGGGATVLASGGRSVGSNEPELRSYARRAAEDVDLDPDLFEAQIEAESNFDPDAGSPAGAQGVAQIMPDTAAAWGVDPSDPKAALKEAAKRMKGYVDKYDGDVEKALAAYNAGEGAVAQYGGVPPYAETRNYIAKIRAKADTLREQGPSGPAPPRRGAATKKERGVPQPARRGVAIRKAPVASRSPEERAAIASYLLNRGRPGSISELAQNLAAARLADDQVEAVAQRPQKTTATRAGRTAKKRPGFSGRAGGGWGGAQDPAAELAAIGTALGLRVTSTKRDNQNPYSGKGSDHERTKRNAFAYDLSNGSAPTREMDQAAFRIARALGNRAYKFGTPINYKVRVGGVRVQLIYRGTGEAFGGDHRDHVHVGVEAL